jgi:hypothetical protein
MQKSCAKRGLGIRIIPVVAAAVFMALMLSSCLKTKEVLITVSDVCADKKAQENPDDYRDPYDNCLMEKEDYVKSDVGCIKLCTKYCTDAEEMAYKDMWVDFAGCHCFCERKIG